MKIRVFQFISWSNVESIQNVNKSVSMDLLEICVLTCNFTTIKPSNVNIDDSIFENQICGTMSQIAVIVVCETGLS